MAERASTSSASDKSADKDKSKRSASARKSDATTSASDVKNGTSSKRSASAKGQNAKSEASTSAAKTSAKKTRGEERSNPGFTQQSDVSRSEFSDRVLEPLVPYEKNEAVSELLSEFLSDSYVIYVKTHGYHWNVRGPHFGSLHKLTEEHYQDLAAAIDVIAERIRALGENAPGSMAQFRRLSDLEEAEGVPTAEEMVRDLASDHTKMSKRAAELIKEAEDADDAVTADLATARKAFHDKASWMLRSFLG